MIFHSHDMMKGMLRYFGLLFTVGLMVALDKSMAGEPPVLPKDWVVRIQNMAEKLSKRKGVPVESFSVTFNKDGTILHKEGYSLAVIPTDAVRTSKTSFSHHACGATFDAKGELRLNDKPGEESGPDGYDLFPISELPKVCEDLIVIRRLQRAFIAHGLDYTLEADVVAGRDGKSWYWLIGPSEEQMPNIIYGMHYYPDTGELRSTRIDVPGIAKKLEAAARDAGMGLVWVKNMRDL